jgi:hypothetical protein
MNAQLVKIDVAADLMNRGIPDIMDMVDGGTLLVRGLTWVWNVARDPHSRDRELRFWRNEVVARGSKDVSVHRRYSSYEIEWVINKILPWQKKTIHAGELDQLFQLRPRTRIDLHDEICGTMMSGRNSYSRDIIAAFLKRRWLASLRSPSPGGEGRDEGGRKYISPDKAKTSHATPKGATLSVNRLGRLMETSSPANSFPK